MLSEIKHHMGWRFSISQILCLLLLFGVSIGYTDGMGKEISIFGLLLDRSNEGLLRVLNVFEIWSSVIATYTSIMYPILVCIGFSFSIYYEKKGFRRNIFIRKNRGRYCFDKVTGAVISGGMTFFVAYLIIGVLIRFRAVGFLVFFSMESNEFMTCLVKLICSFLYGMELSLFFIVVSVFFDDKYELMCLPILIKYLVHIVSDRVLILGMKADSSFFIHVSQVTLNPENIISNYSLPIEKVESVGIMIVFYILAICLLNVRIRRDGKYGKI